MKNSDFIKMTTLGVYSIAFPVENIRQTLDEAVLDDCQNVKYEILKNPMTGKKIHELDDGIFFSIRAEFKQVTPALLATKSYEIKLRDKNTSEGDVELLALAELYQLLPPSSEIYNVFYDTSTQLLVMNNNSKRAKLALGQLVKVFGSIGVKSIIVSEEKLDLTKKLTQFLQHNIPLFTGLCFENEATLKRSNIDEKAYLSCKHLNTERGKDKARKALDEGFEVQSLKISYLNNKFKIDSDLNIRSMYWSEFNRTARRLNGDEAAKSWIFQEYINQQFEALRRIMKYTILEFTEGTKLEEFL